MLPLDYAHVIIHLYGILQLQPVLHVSINVKHVILNILIVQHAQLPLLEHIIITLVIVIYITMMMVQMQLVLPVTIVAILVMQVDV